MVRLLEQFLTATLFLPSSKLFKLSFHFAELENNDNNIKTEKNIFSNNSYCEKLESD